MSSFSKILDMCRGLSRDLSDVVFIGGVAVYLHALGRSMKVPLEASHDADFMVSLSDYGVLKDIEEITPTPRLSKHQMFVDGVEFDVYVERLNRLVVPYDEVYAHSLVVEDVRVACLEHLLVLKLEALGHRGQSSKGDKDRRDVVKIGLMLGRKVRRELVEPYHQPSFAKMLGEVARSSIFIDLSDRNAHAAKKVRAAFVDFVGRISF